ncbi:hypothetical protein DOTSEDRAFT_168118 [Dothistroma septosporum NZE10]|uniref:gamma-glutamylcyclotransferase n=1 Tax=Dothistroma septosporum (strain NZE10 / CBS 128990) TaxID=675120 RepID=N1PSK8_DOTSN|nr:hypothetical protein DOTSEDRAFT_168118 [Dothistroma septosporum NZE10]
MLGPARSKAANVDTSQRFSELYFGYASNLSPEAIKGRCPDSLFCGLAVLKGWKWNINSTGYGNIVPSGSDEVWGSLSFLSPRDEAGLDESEGVPWAYEKKWVEVERMNADGSGTGAMVKVMTYVDTARPDEGTIMGDYVIWIHKEIRDARGFGLPDAYVERYLRPWIPAMTREELKSEEAMDIQFVRVMQARKG